MTNHDESASLDCCVDCCTDGDPEAALNEIRDDDMGPDVVTVRSAGFKLLFETGEPITLDDLLGATGMPATKVREVLDEARAQGRVEFDDEGRILGIAGLTVVPSRHELIVDGSSRWTWCAVDAVGILGALNATGIVKSTDAHTGDAIEIKFIDGTPDTGAHLFILGGYSESNVREKWCPNVNFFTDRFQANQWVSNNNVEGDIRAVADIASDLAAMWRPLVGT